MKRFAVGETSISDASRPIKDKEVTAAADNGIEFIELAFGDTHLFKRDYRHQGFLILTPIN